MKAIIELAATEPYWRKDSRYWKLLHCLMAVHNKLSHDSDRITFLREDGYTLYIDLAVSYVSFGEEGKAEEERFWAEPVDDGPLLHLLMLFTDRRDDEIRAFEGMARP